MLTSLWPKLHGGATHLPIVLLAMAFLFDASAHFGRRDALRPGLEAAALVSLVLATFGAILAVISGIYVSRGVTLGAGALWWHHVFVWPSFGLSVALCTYRLMCRFERTRSGTRLYLVLAALAAGAMVIAGFWGGELLVA